MQKNVLEYLEATVAKFPEKVAYGDEESTTTFSQVYKNSRAIGSFLNKIGIYKEPVVVFMNRTVHSITAFYGVVYGGNFYVPIDPEIPHFRIELILKKLDPKIIICDKNTRDIVNNFEYSNSIYLYNDIINTDIDESSIEIIRNKAIDTDPLYVVFTSGSTGIPKGVVSCHRSVIDYIDNLTDILMVDENTIFGNQTPLYLDASLKELYSTLKYGCTTYIIPKKLFMFPIKLVEFLNDYKINTVCWVVSALTIISGLKVLDSSIPKYLKTIAFGSEVFPMKQFKLWKKALPDASFINLYGPTEGTGMCTYYKIHRKFEDGEPIPIGKPFNNVDVFLLNEKNQLALEDEFGEICIRGTSLTMGYFKDDERTDQVFVQNPLNKFYPELIYRTGDIGKYNKYGELIFSSRKDHQIKHMGHRIELGEIEVNVNKIDNIINCCCVYNDLKQKIVLYYVGDISSKEISSILKETLPRYMMPNKIVSLEKMPLHQTEKLIGCI